jgi:hypothetical protein
MSNFPGAARTGAVGFSIGAKGYMGTGQDAVGTLLKDFWEYDPTSDTWTAKTSFGGTARWNAVGFSIGTKGYIGTGNNTADFWEYDPTANTWTAKANYAGGAMSASAGWGVSSTGKGYLGGCGLDALSNFTKKFYEYDQATNTWTAKAQPPFSVSTSPLMRYWGVGFAIGTKGYLLSGMSTMGSNMKDLYEYDPGTNTWAARASYTTGFGVWNATGFGLGTKGYMVTGEDDAGNTPNFHREYNPATNTWGLATAFPGTGRQVCTSFTVNGCGYVITGRDNVVGALKEVWRWCPPAALPIELLAFTGKNFDHKNILQWITASEQNNAFFILERSTDAVHFEFIGTVKGSGNSTTIQNYKFIDADYPQDSKLFYYRLKQMDLSNNLTVSGIVPIEIKDLPEANIYFDHSSQNLNVIYPFSLGGIYTIDIYDVMGRLIHTQNIIADENTQNLQQISLPSCSDGIFIAKFYNRTGDVNVQTKFLK